MSDELRTTKVLSAAEEQYDLSQDRGIPIPDPEDVMVDEHGPADGDHFDDYERQRIAKGL